MKGKEKALKKLTSNNKRSVGRNPSGRITVFYWGGGLKIFADIPITRKPTEVRMGKGKGNPIGWMARVVTG
ncbi:hypothetical protein L7F22_044493 [Adiantum nelumboides]|nr:hypothetical protein [Adiantum nelumboides]MCO5590523.1 hypothetical protein [Adiantum nelumboides]